MRLTPEKGSGAIKDPKLETGIIGEDVTFDNVGEERPTRKFMTFSTYHFLTSSTGYEIGIRSSPFNIKE